MTKIKVYQVGSKERKNLELFEGMVNTMCDSRFFIEIKNIYFDVDSDWMYTSPVTYDMSLEYIASWQSLNAKNYEKLVSCENIVQVAEIADAYIKELNDKYNK